MTWVVIVCARCVAEPLSRAALLPTVFDPVALRTMRLEALGRICGPRAARVAISALACFGDYVVLRSVTLGSSLSGSTKS